MYNTVTCRPIARERVKKTFPYRWILGKKLVTEHVSMDKKMQAVFMEIDSWKQQFAVGSTGVSVDTDTLYKRPFI
jgi:hypothetical protein